jgi:hypothetical protein
MYRVLETPLRKVQDKDMLHTNRLKKRDGGGKIEYIYTVLGLHLP